MKSILVATDLSGRSERAVRRAFRLAEMQGSALTVLSIVDDDLPADLATELKAATEKKLSQLCQSIAAYPCTIRVEIDDLLLRIHTVADDVDADLIVLGVHRSRPFGDLFSGTTMERLVRGSLRPVLLVRDPVDQDYAHSVCGIDLSPACVAAAKATAMIAPEAPIATFHAFNPPFRGVLALGGATTASVYPFQREVQTRLVEWLVNADLPQQAEVPEMIAASVPEALRRMMEKTGSDLIAIGAHGRSSLAPTYLGSFAEDLLRSPPCDILIVRR
ncbi:MAG: universal stress protein [Pseudomonadota bacterium]